MPRTTVYNKDLTEKYEKINRKNKKLLDDFIDYCHSMDKTELTIKNYKSQIKIFLCWNKKFNKDTFFCDLQRKDFLTFFGYARTELKVSPARIYSFKAALSSFSTAIEILYEKKYKNFRNLVRDLPSIPQAPVREKTILSVEQVQEMINFFVEKEDYQIACYLALLCSSGCRVSEAIQMKASFFDEKHEVFGGLMYLTDKIRTKGKGSIGKVIGRYVIKSSFKPYFDLWQKQREKLGVKTDYLFIKITSQEPADISTANFFVSKINKQFNCDFYNHCARHFMVSQLKRLGLTTEDIKEVMKWSDVKMVEIYDDSSSEERIHNVFTKLEKRQKEAEGEKND